MEVVQKRYQSGNASQPDLLKVQTELARQQNSLADFTNQRRSAIAKINALLDRRSTALLAKPSEKNEPQTEVEADLLTERALKQRQEVLIAESKVARTELAIQLGETMNRPLASQGYSQFERGMMPEASEGESRSSYGLRQKSNDRPAYAQAESFLSEMRKRLESERHLLDNQTAQTRSMAQTIVDSLKVAQREVELVNDIVLPQNQSAYDTTMNDYTSGGSTFLDLLDAERELIRARLELHKARKTFNQTVVRLAKVSGQVVK